jgi:hypothetical protein
MNRKFFFIPLLLLITFLMVGTAAAQTPVTAVMIAPEGPFTVGDPIELQLAVTHPAGYHVIQPKIPESWGSFIVTSQAEAETVTLEDGQEMTLFVIDARLFAPGEFSTPPLTVSITDGAGQLSEVTAAPVPITLASLLVEGDTALRDIKPQAELPFLNLIPWIAGGVLLAAAAAAVYHWWKRRQARLALAAVDNRLPHEIALDDLTRIGQLGLPEQQRFKEHYTLVSDTVRIYIERTQGVPMLERTTGEIRSGLRNSTLTTSGTRQLINFLEESDLVKFSKFTPTESEAYETITQARQIVETTMLIVITEADIDDTLAATDTPADHSFSANGKMKNIEVSA